MKSGIKKKRRFISFIVIPDDYTEPIRFRMRAGMVRFLEIVGAILLIHIVFGAVFYYNYYKLHKENVVLKVEKAKLERENSQIYSIARKFEDLEDFSRRLKISLGISKIDEPGLDLTQSDGNRQENNQIQREEPSGTDVSGRLYGDVEAAFRRVSDTKSMYHSMYKYLPTLLPVDGYISLDFDATNFNEPVARERHLGIDIVAKRGSVIKAAGSGTIVFAGWTPDLGNLMILYHGNDLFTFYAHNLRFIRREGNVVKGEPISLLGNSGQTSSGPHLHFEIWREGTPINPREFLFSLQSDQNTEM